MIITIQIQTQTNLINWIITITNKFYRHVSYLNLIIFAREVLVSFDLQSWIFLLIFYYVLLIQVWILSIIAKYYALICGLTCQLPWQYGINDA